MMSCPKKAGRNELVGGVDGATRDWVNLYSDMGSHPTTHPLENLHGISSVIQVRDATHHQDERSDSTQWTINLSRSLGERIGRSLAFSYSSMGMT